MEGNQTCFFCHEKNGLEICKHCESVAYCSEQHRLIHRPETICFPFAVGQAPHVGRYMIATRDIKASGTLNSINDPLTDFHTLLKCVRKKQHQNLEARKKRVQWLLVCFVDFVW